MPLINGFSEENIHENIKHEIAAGKTRNQAVAIALEKAGIREQKKRDCVVKLGAGLNTSMQGKQTGQQFN